MSIFQPLALQQFYPIFKEIIGPFERVGDTGFVLAAVQQLGPQPKAVIARNRLSYCIDQKEPFPVVIVGES